MARLRVSFLPLLIEPQRLAGGICAVIDVLRATTTTVCALAAGARQVVPCLSIADARLRAQACPPGGMLLGGERGGLPIDGFDLGNSPAEYTPEVVAGKTVVLTTTNGTKAMLHCHQADAVLIAAFVNLSAVCDALSAGSQINLICAGTDGAVSRDDVLVAGAIVAQLSDRGNWTLDDEALVARDAWLAVVAGVRPADLESRLVAALRDSQGGRNLIGLGMDRDILLAAEVDRVDSVPRYRSATGVIDLSQ